MAMENIYNDVYNAIKNETTKISQKAFDVLDREGVVGIVKSGNAFWIEHYSSDWNNDCPKTVKNYLIRFIKRKFGLKYLYD